LRQRSVRPLKYLASGTAAEQVGSGQYLPLDDARFMFGFPPKAEIGGAIYECTALGRVDSWDSQINQIMIQGCFLGGSLGRH